MPITGVLQPNELIIYRPDQNGDTTDPAFARFSYAFEGLSTTSPPSAGEIVAMCRSDDVVGTKLPSESDPPPGFSGLQLPQTRVRVTRYSRQGGQARIVVEWGVRYSSGGGAAPAVTQIRSVATGTQIDQPIVVRQSIVDLYSPFPENTEFDTYRVINQRVPRGTIRLTSSKLVTFSGGLTPESVSQIGAANYNKMFTYLGSTKILVAISVTPISSVQGYINTEFVQYTPVPALAQGVAVNTSEPLVSKLSLPVQALGYNDEYGVPTNEGTPARAAYLLYDIGNLSALPWL